MRTDFLRNFKQPSFLLKFTATILNAFNICLWRIPEDGKTGLSGSVFEECLFAHTVPAYMVVLPALCLADLPGRWLHRVFLGPGAILFAATGTLGMINCTSDPTLKTPPLLIAGTCLVICVVLVADLILNENLFGLFRRSSDSVD